MIDVENLDEAIAIAARIRPAKKGTVEIRPVLPLPELPQWIDGPDRHRRLLRRVDRFRAAIRYRWALLENHGEFNEDSISNRIRDNAGDSHWIDDHAFGRADVVATSQRRKRDRDRLDRIDRIRLALTHEVRLADFDRCQWHWSDGRMLLCNFDRRDPPTRKRPMGVQRRALRRSLWRPDCRDTVTAGVDRNARRQR